MRAVTERPLGPGFPPPGRSVRRGAAAASRRGAAGVFAAVALVASGCLLLQDPHASAPQYTFTAPLTDTVVNVGDTTGVLGCDLRVDGAPLPCSLAILFTGSDVVTVQEGPRLVIERAQRTGPFGAPDLVPGVTRATMRPLNV
ncbi:MAG: hypothetical protein FIA95_15120, partial [Gemmatimonadetes bacterium]|nr:hypothetical protein [Gemmatimonadota bacterium]